jgi:hypothetical protein
MEYHLRIGRKKTGLVVKPDVEYPNLYRIHYKGEVSDIVNLSRAKDAALNWARPPGAGGSAVEDYKWESAESPRA